MVTQYSWCAAGNANTPNHTKGMMEQLVTIAIANILRLNTEISVNTRPSEHQMIIAVAERGRTDNGVD